MNTRPGPDGRFYRGVMIALLLSAPFWGLMTLMVIYGVMR